MKRLKKYLTRELKCVIMESMKRIDVLKGIEQILVQKAYETGHISHRADGDWQKQADGSWIPYKGQSSQSAPQTQENSPTTNKLSKEEKANINNKLYDVLSFYDSDSKELFGVKRINGGGVDGSPNISYDWKTNKILSTDKDKFDKIVRHYMDKAGVEDTPLNYKQAYNTIKGMAINNGMLNRTNHPLDTEYGEITEEDLVETPNDTIYSTEDITTTTIDGEDAYEIAGTPIIAVKDPTGKWQVMDGDKIVADGLNTALAHETMVKTMNDKHGFDDDQIGFSSYANNINIDNGVADNDDLEDVANQILIDNDLEITDENMNKARNAMLSWLDTNGYLDSNGSENSTDVDEEKTVISPKMDWEGISMSSVDKPAQYILENLEDFEGEDMDDTIKTFIKGAGDREQQIIDATKRYIQRQVESDGKKLTWYSDGTYSIEKSAVRDMRSAPATKNMGF